MPIVIVHHDLPIAEMLDDKREQLTVTAADTNERATELLLEGDILVINPRGGTGQPRRVQVAANDRRSRSIVLRTADKRRRSTTGDRPVTRRAANRNASGDRR